MLYLNSRVHFDEIVLSCLIKKEFHCTGTSIVNCLCNLDCVIADGFSLLIGQAKSRCKFDNLLMSSLNRAVSLIKMNDVSLFISQYLHLDMFRVFKIFFNENIVYAEGLCSFASGASELRQEFFLGTNNSHTSSAAACCCLEHYRISAALCKLQSFFFCFDGFLYARNSRNAYGVCHNLGFNLIAESIHHFSCRSDKLDSFSSTGLCKLYVFCKETISRVDSVYALGLCQSNDFIDTQICSYWGLALSNLIRLVSFSSE